jgi:hypothetical protein
MRRLEPFVLDEVLPEEQRGAQGSKKKAATNLLGVFSISKKNQIYGIFGSKMNHRFHRWWNSKTEAKIKENPGVNLATWH